MVSLETTLALQLPVIDFISPDLKPGTVEWDSVRGNVRKALEEFGCFEALFDRVPFELRKAVFDASEEVFKLPLETKQRVVSKRKYRGYVGQIPTLPLLEVMGVDFAENADQVNAFTQKLWPQGNSSFSEPVMSFSEHISKLDFMTRRMVMESFGLDESYINEHLNSTKCLVRMMKYQGVEETEEEELGMEVHMDRNMLTILCQNDVNDGLEVRTKDGKHWIKVNPSQDSSFIVLGGAMLHGKIFSPNGNTTARQIDHMSPNNEFDINEFDILCRESSNPIFLEPDLETYINLHWHLSLVIVSIKMGSETPLLPLNLPVIDFSNQNLKPGEPEWDLTRADVLKALQDYGCFEASFNKIPIELRKSIFEVLEELFDLPLQTKLENVSKKPFHGYVGQYPMVPLYESMGIDDSDVVDKVNAFTEKLWPQGNSSFSTTIHLLSKKLSELDITIRRMIMESLGLVKHIDEHLNSTNYLMRVMKYKGPDTEETTLGLNAHTDKNIVTIIYQNHVEGLEVQTKDNSWIKVKPSQNSFIVMIGDSLYALLNGRVHSPYHRVMMTGNQTRYSLGLFSIPKAGHIISSPAELVDEEHPRLFKPFDHIEFLQFYYTEAGQRSQSALKIYCGFQYE